MSSSGNVMKIKPDYELEVLLELDGFEFDFASRYIVKFEVRRVKSYGRAAHLAGSNTA